MRRKAVTVPERPPVPERLRFPFVVEDFLHPAELVGRSVEEILVLAGRRGAVERVKWEESHPWPKAAWIPLRRGPRGPVEERDDEAHRQLLERRACRLGGGPARFREDT